MFIKMIRVMKAFINKQQMFGLFFFLLLVLCCTYGCASKKMPMCGKELSSDPEKLKMIANNNIEKCKAIPEGVSKIRIENAKHSNMLIKFSKGDQCGCFFVDKGKSYEYSVPNGCYKMFFVYSNDPQSLYQGDDICVHNQISTIYLQSSFGIGGNYNLNKIR